MACPNILLITTDQQRFDTLSCVGAPIGRTPHIDAMAARGTLFTRCYIQTPVCIPSRASLQTGRYPHQHGVRYMESVIDTTPGLPPAEWTFHERLRAAGYHTAAFGKIHMMPERGFDTVQVTGGKGARRTQSTGQDIGPGPLGTQYAAWLEARLPGGYERIYRERRRPEYKARWTALGHPLPAELHVDTWTCDNTVDFLRNPPSGPWFVQCGFTGPHGPLDVPPEYLDRYDPDEMPEPETWTADLRDRLPYGTRLPRARTPEDMEKARRFTAYYHALMDLIDDQIARIAQAMDERGLWDNTLVVFTSDHGEMVGDLGLYSKGNFYEPVVRMPMFVIPPSGRVAGPRFEGLVEMFAIAPTALDYAGVPIPEHMAAGSLRPELESGEGGREAVFGEYTTNDRAMSGVYVRTESHKLVLWAEASGETGGELYDMQADPCELHNRLEDPGPAGSRSELTQRIVERWLRTDAAPPPGEWGGAEG